jgi:Zn-dependent protease
MTICYHCGQEVVDPHTCPECGQIFCSLHINQIEHNCSIVKDSMRGTSVLTHQSNILETAPQANYSAYDSQSEVSMNSVSQITRGTTDGTYTWYRQEKYIPEDAFDPDSGIKFSGIILPHKSELMHFLIGSALIFIIGFLSSYNPSLFAAGYGWTIFMLAGFYVTAFLFHEFGHRETALRFGLQTKFRLLKYGMIITVIGLISSLLGLFTGSPLAPSAALPGAVVVLGLDKVNRKTGLCKAAGPSVNLVYGSILLIISYIMPSSLYPINHLIALGAFFNFILGVFNMIPLGILDGQNIWKWSKKVYFFLMGALLILLIITFTHI